MKIFYLSGSGNSYWAAKKIAGEFDGECSPILRLGTEQTLSEADLAVGIAVPAHMLDIPWLAKEFLMKLQLQKEAYVFAVMTYNKKISEQCFQSIDAALQTHGAALSAGFAVQMPGNCIASTPEQDRERLGAAPERIQEICREIRQRKETFASGGAAADADFVEKSFFYDPKHPLKQLVITEKCSGCGVCAALCPLDNICVTWGKAVHNTECTVCLACLHWCPNNAVYIDQDGFRTLRQYHHPEVTLKELLAHRNSFENRMNA